MQFSNVYLLNVSVCILTCELKRQHQKWRHYNPSEFNHRASILVSSSQLSKSLMCCFLKINTASTSCDKWGVTSSYWLQSVFSPLCWLLNLCMIFILSEYIVNIMDTFSIWCISPTFLSTVTYCEGNSRQRLDQK